MSTERGLPRPIIDIDSKRLEFWKSMGLIHSIRKEILQLTGWLDENQDTQIVVETSRGLMPATPHSMLENERRDYSAVFSAPVERRDKRRLALFLDEFELELSQKRAIDKLIRNAQAQNIDTKNMEDTREWLLRERGMMFGLFNSLLNTMHFDVSETSLAELRYQASAKKVRIERIREDMDND